MTDLPQVMRLHRLRQRGEHVLADADGFLEVGEVGVAAVIGNGVRAVPTLRDEHPTRNYLGQRLCILLELPRPLFSQTKALPAAGGQWKQRQWAYEAFLLPTKWV